MISALASDRHLSAHLQEGGLALTPPNPAEALRFGGVKRIPNSAAELFRLFKVACISEGSEPRRATSSAYSMSTKGQPGSSSTPQVSETGREDSISEPKTKLNEKGESEHSCLSPGS